MSHWQAIRDLANELKRPIGTLLALAAGNDPFYLGEARLRDAKWFAKLYHEHDFTAKGVHLRRIHYRLISQETPVLLPGGEAYENTNRCWESLCAAAKSARYAGLVEVDDFVDQRNPAADERLPDVVEVNLEILASNGTLCIEIPSSLPNPSLQLLEECPTQPYHIEIWAEKSTVNDVLSPLSARYG